MNITATNAQSEGYLVAYASDGSRPNTTNVSYGANSTVSTLSHVKVSPGGRIKIYSSANTDVAIDVQGWISAPVAGSLSYVSVDPTRVLDTRIPVGVCSPDCGSVGANSTMSLQVSGQGGVPTDDISAVVVNLTAINATDTGELVAYAWGDVVPGGTSLVYGSGGVMSNAAIVPVDANGRIALLNSAPLDVVVDVVGYYTNAGDFDTWSYAYSPDGIRSTKSGPDTNTTYKWDRASGLSMLLSETTTNVGTTYYIYGPAGLPIEQINADGSVYFIHHDQLGSTRLITNAAGNAVATISYDAYGNETARSSNASSPFGFAGQYSDPESGYQYLRARYYDPSTGQFLTRDPIDALTRSAYGYVYGNPLNATDPCGLWVGGACSDVSVGFVAYVSLQGCSVMDGHGDRAFLPIATAGASSPTASATAGFMFSNAESVEDLRGLTACIGGGVGEGIVGGVEVCFGLTNKGDSFQFNGVFSIYVGAGVGLNGVPFAEGRMTLGYTGVVCLPNEADMLRKFLELGGGRVSLPPVTAVPLAVPLGD